MHERKQAHKHKDLCDPVAQRQSWRLLSVESWVRLPPGLRKDYSEQILLIFRILRVRLQELPARHPPLRAPQELSQGLQNPVISVRYN